MCAADMGGRGGLFCFRPGTFDAAISISAVQWLCNESAASAAVSFPSSSSSSSSGKRGGGGGGGAFLQADGSIDVEAVSLSRLGTLFRALRSCLRRGAPAVFQFYPEKPGHVALMRRAALAQGFTGGAALRDRWMDREGDVL